MADVTHTPAEIAAKKAQFRQWLLLFIASIVVAGTVGLGEALVAVYFSGSFAVVLPAFLISFVLFRMDTFDLFDSFVGDRLFKDKDGKSFTKWKGVALKIAMALAIFAGAACGFLQLNSILITFGSLFWGLSAVAAVTAAPLTLMILACSVAFISAVANTALLYMNVEKFIRDEEYTPYIETFNMIFGRSDKKMGWKLFHIIFAVTGVTLAVSIYLITLGLYKAQAMTVFNSFCNFSMKTSIILTNLVVHPGQILNGFFYARNVVNLIKKIESGLKSLINKILPKTWQDLEPQSVAANVAQDKDSNANNNQIPWLALSYVALSTVGYIVVFYCAATNGIAQGQGAANEKLSWDWLTKIKIPTSIAQPFVFGLMAVASTSANFFASIYETFLHPPADSIGRIKKYFGQHKSDLAVPVEDGNDRSLSSTSTVPESVGYTGGVGSIVTVRAPAPTGIPDPSGTSDHPVIEGIEEDRAGSSTKSGLG